MNERTMLRWIGAVAMIGLVAVPARATDWVTFSDETSVRLVAAPARGANDPDEKDYAWGDLDQDGDIDLVCVRKQPFTTAGRRENVLFMNEGVTEGHAINGVLVDRTAEYAEAADDGGNGFGDQTNDRDVVVVDVNGDGWLDVVTCTTVSDGLPKTISHPRVYLNLGETDGMWEGLLYQEFRTPQIWSVDGAGQPVIPVAPRFCSITAGDVTGNNAPDLYFGDYDSSGGGGVPMPAGHDVNDRLWTNDGFGTFTDSLQQRMTAEMLVSAFGTAVAIRDMNEDGVNDVVKDTGLASPTRVSVSYNNPLQPGFFNAFDVPSPGQSPYFISVDDLNGDGRLDILITDDATDRYMLNVGNGADQRADFTALTLPSSTAGFGGNSVINDLDRDGWPDAIITDVDVDIPGCSRTTVFLRNNGNGPNVTFTDDTPDGIGPRQGVHDIAVFDIDGDGWDDLVVGRCSTTEIYMNEPPIGVSAAYPAGRPELLTPDQTTTFTVTLTAIGGVTIVPGSEALHAAVDGGGFVTSSLAPLGGDQYEATLPAAGCLESVAYYVSAEVTGGAVFTDPAAAPAATYAVIAADGIAVLLADDIEGDVSAWTIENTSIVTGAWEQVDPHGTSDSGNAAAPENDATVVGTMAFVTEDGPAGGSAAATDVDGGPTTLTSPVFGLAGGDAVVTYARWFYTNLGAADVLVTQISNDDGATWENVNSTGGTGGAWETVSFNVSDAITPTAEMRLRFVAMDSPNDSITEAGIDDVRIETFTCVGGPACVEDVDGDANVGFSDVLAIFGVWGPCPGCPEDTDGDDLVGFSDLLSVLTAWGPCP